MEEKRFNTNKLTASQARQQADTTNSLHKHIYKKIDENSKDGLCWLEWNVWGYSIPLVNMVVADLKSFGYTVTFNYDVDLNYSPVIVDPEKVNETKKLISLTITW